jgi:hypothetical protein
MISPEGDIVHPSPPEDDRGEVVRRLPVRVGQEIPQHIFGGPVFVPRSLELDRHPQTERTCSVCGAVKVTVHAPAGGGWREWRVGASTAQIETNEAPPCMPGSAP